MTRKKAAASHNRAWLSALLSIVPSAIIAIDAKQRITFFNKAAEKLFGYREEEIMGRRLGLLMPHRFRLAHIREVEQFWGDLEQSRRMGVDRNIVGLRKDGTEFPAEASISKIEIDAKRTFAVTLQDITMRQREDDQIRLQMRELSHRSKNMLNVVQAIARLTAEPAHGDFASRFSERLAALAASHDLLVKNEWVGVNLDQLVRSQLAHFEDLIGKQIELQGPSLFVSAPAAQIIGMALHELATNAGKYGAFTDGAGRVFIQWSTVSSAEGAETFVMEWREQVTHAITEPTKRGFGWAVMCEMAALSLGAQVNLDFPPSGLVWRLQCPAAEVLEAGQRTQPDK